MMRNRRFVTIELSVPVEMTNEAVEAVLNMRMHAGKQAVAEAIDQLENLRCTNCNVKEDSEHSFGREPVLDFSNAHYIGNDEVGIYFEAYKELPGRWYLYGIANSNTGDFCDSIWNELGPFYDYDRAIKAGRNGAIEWCNENNVLHGEESA